MEERKTIKISLSTMFLIIAIMVIAIMGYCIYTMSNNLKTLEKENQELSNSEINNAETDNKVESNKTEEDTNIQDEETPNDDAQPKEDTTGKIYIKRNGITTLEEVPTELVGKYVNSNSSEDYFTINADGTVSLSVPSGGGPSYIYTENEVELQLTYIPNSSFGEIILEFYDKTDSNNKQLISPFIYGEKNNEGKYRFATLTHTPSANALEYVYEKQ